MNDAHRTLLAELGPDTIAALEALFCPDRSIIRGTTEKNILALSDADYGRAMKVLYASEQHFNDCIATLKALSRKIEKPHAPIAPR